MTERERDNATKEVYKAKNEVEVALRAIHTKAEGKIDVCVSISNDKDVSMDFLAFLGVIKILGRIEGARLVLSSVDSIAERLHCDGKQHHFVALLEMMEDIKFETKRCTYELDRIFDRGLVK